MRYWVLSPNISMSRGRMLERWKEIIRDHEAVFMGWSPDPAKDGRKGLGQKFAGKYPHNDIIILSAHRQNWEWKLVACGKANSEARTKGLDLPRGFGYGSFRLLRPFVPLKSRPESSGMSLRDTSPDRRRNVETLIELKPNENPADRRLCARLKALVERTVTHVESALDLLDEEGLESLPKKRYEEGCRRFVLHRRLEGVRSRQLVMDAKGYFKKTHRGKLTCEVCNADFEDEYGARGRNFIEAHHRIPIAKLKTKTKMRISDLAMVCSNCHRMLHRPPWISVDELRTIWKKLNGLR